MNVLGNLFISFGVGVFAYGLSAVWIEFGNYPPTMSTPGIAWWLNGVALLFWLITFVVLSIYEIKKAH